jgi:pimeloyl-ACP methyl ester carboxylesterase
MGGMSTSTTRCNFVVVHDFFDTCDATALLFKPITLRHDGCQALCFNYPGQANTVWPRLPAAERERGAREPVLNNDWIADRMHELLLHAEDAGELLLSKPFHLVGVGNGACIAAAFCQRWGSHEAYAHSLRSLVSVNGFLSPDPQLAAILHSGTYLLHAFLEIISFSYLILIYVNPTQLRKCSSRRRTLGRTSLCPSGAGSSSPRNI